MQKLKGVFYSFVTALVLGAVGYVVVNYYSFIFSVNIDGQVHQIERVTQPMMVVGSQVSAPTDPNLLYSYAVSIRDKKGVIHTATSTDRQWAVVHKGICVEAKIFPYPFWNLDKSGTYFNARLLLQKDCGPEFSQVPPSPVPESAPIAPAPVAPAETAKPQ